MLTKVSLLLLSLSSSAFALSQCVVSDSNWNLLAFGFDGKDYNLGTQDSWSSGSPEEITADGRPPFTGQTVTCHLNQYSNVIYVLGADSSSLSDIYVFNGADKTWSKQTTTTNNFDPSTFTAILDHDTNVFYAMSKGVLYALNMDEIVVAKPDAIEWVDVGAPSFSVDGYDPVMGLAQNHVHFIGAPGLEEGNAYIFVIHFAYFQPEAQWYGASFPETHGQAPSIFKGDNTAQTQFAYIPDSAENAYVIDVSNNQTATLPGPSADSAATYFATTSAIVQLTSAGQMNFIPYDVASFAAGAESWSSISKFASVVVPSGSASQSSPSSSGTTAPGSVASGTPSDDTDDGLQFMPATAFATALVAVLAFLAV